MNECPVISVVVPIYKVEKYLPRCLDSIMKQTFTDFEALMIDDGSPDRCAAISSEYEKKDKRFKLFQKPNGGLSDARNYGIKYAKGEYIVFIDSDDCIHKDYLKVMYESCVNNNAEISYCRFKSSYFMGNICIPMFSAPKKSVLDSEKALDLLIRDSSLHSYAWNKMYKKSLFTDNDISYPKMYFEDVATSPRLFFHASKIAVSDRYLYYYEKRVGSIMATMDIQKVNDLMLSILIIKNYIKYNNVYQKYRPALKYLSRKMYLVNIYSILKQNIKCLNFSNMGFNLKINRKLYKYLISDEYNAISGIPELPFKMQQPENKKIKSS